MRNRGSLARRRADRPALVAAVLVLVLVLVLAAGACGRDVTRRDVASPRQGVFPAVPTTAAVAVTTTTEVREPEPHWTSNALCTRDGEVRPGGAVIAAIWDRSFALGCGALVDSSTGTRIGWVAAEDVVTLANGAVIGRRSVAKSPTFAGGDEFVMLNASGRVVAPYGVLPADVDKRPLSTWLPSTEQGIFLGLWNEAWRDAHRASGASGLSGSGADLLVYDSRTGEMRSVDPSAQFRTTPADLAQWWVVDGQLLLAGRQLGVLAIAPGDLTVRWKRTPAELGGAPVAESLDFGRVGTIPIAKGSAGTERSNLDVRSGEIDRSPTANAVVRGAVQVPMTRGFAVHGGTQIFVNNGFAAAVRNGAQLWSYPGTRGPCDFAELPVAGSVGLVMACGQFVAYQRA